MKLAQVHVEFWRQRTTRIPKWMADVQPRRPVTIDEVVNAHAGIRVERNDAGSLLMILRLKGKRGGREELISGLVQMSVSPETVINPKRRSGYCRKWLARIYGIRAQELEYILGIRRDPAVVRAQRDEVDEGN